MCAAATRALGCAVVTLRVCVLCFLFRAASSGAAWITESHPAQISGSLNLRRAFLSAAFETSHLEPRDLFVLERGRDVLSVRLLARARALNTKTSHRTHRPIHLCIYREELDCRPPSVAMVPCTNRLRSFRGREYYTGTLPGLVRNQTVPPISVGDSSRSMRRHHRRWEE